MLSVAPFVGSPAGVATVQHFTARDADGSSSHGGAVVSPHICTSSCLPRGNNYIRAHGDRKAVLTPFAVTHRSANGTEDERARAHGDTSKSPSAVRTASWMTRNATESASAGAEARAETTITLALGSSQLPARSLIHLVNRLPSSITSMSLSSSVALSACDSVDVDAAAAAAHIPCVPPSPPPVTSSDDSGLRSISSPNGAAPTPAERHWVPYDVYLSLSAPLLHDRVLQDRVATLCCPMTLSGDDHSQLVNIHSILPFLLHGNAVAPPIALATARVTRASTPQSSMQSFSLRSSVPGSLSDEAQRASFPLFCVLGAKSCTVSRRTRSICSIHTPKVPIAEWFCMRPDQHNGGGSHTRNSSDKAALPYPAVQQDHAVKSSSGVETVSPRREGCSDDVLLLFTEQLTGVIPTFPVELLYTTSPTGAIVSAPPAEYTAYWDSWQQTPRAVRRRASYDSIWSVVTLPRLVVMLQRWGVSPAMAMCRLCVRPPGCSTLPLEPTGGSHPLPTTVDAVPREGRGATAVAAVPGALGASRRLQLSLAESSSCLFASPSSLRTGASAQLTREDAVGSQQQHTVGLTINGCALSDSLSSDAGATPESDMCAPSMGGAAAMMSTGSERAAPVECDTGGVTMPGSPGVLLSSSLRGDTDSSLHPYNAPGASDFVNTAADGNRSLHGQAHLYDVPSPPPVALSAPKSFGSVALLRAAVSGVPLRRSSTPSFHHQRSQYQHLLKSALQLRLPICLSRTCANGCRRHTKNVPALHPRHCRGTTGHMAVVSPGTSDRNCDVLAHPYAMPTSEEARQPGIKSRRGRKGRETRHSRHSIRNQETNARDTSAERADATDALEQTRGPRGVSVRQIAAGDFTVHEKAASDAAAPPPPPPPTPTPPTRDGAQYRLNARQRTEHVKKYLQALISAAAHRRAEPLQRAADDTSQQSLQCSAHRCSTSEHIATTKERTPLHPSSGCSCAGVNPERSLNHGRGSADGGSAGMRRVPMPPSSPRPHQLHLYSPPHTNIAHDHSDSICTQRSVDSRTVSGERDSAALGDPAADFSTAHGIEQTYLCNDARTKADAASSTFVGDSMIPSMSASSEGSLASLATVSAVSPATHALHHPKPVSDVHSNSCAADHVDRHGAEGSQSTFFTASSPSSTLASPQVLRQLASPLQSMRTCRLHRNSRLSGPPMLPCLRENSDDCPRACVPPELSSPPLSCHPTRYLPTGTEEPGAAVAVSLRHGGYHNAGTTVSPLRADVLLPPRPQSPTLRAPSEGVTLYNAALSSADHLPLGPRHDSDSAVRHVPVESASAGKSTLSVSGLSLPKGGTSNMQPLSANRNGSGEPRLHVAEKTVPNHPRLHTLVSGHTDSAHNEAMPGSVRHDCTDARPASTFVPPVSPDHQPSGASPDPNLGSADALAASTFRDDAEWPTFLPSSLLGSTLAITTYFSSDADDPTPAASLLPGADSESISPRAGTAALLVNLAACVIQAVGRGYITRRVLRRSSRRATSDPIECAVAVAPSVMPSPYPTLARLNSVFTSSTTVFAGVASASSSGRYHGVATSQGCPPPPLIGFSAPLASPVISTAMTATTIPKDARLSAHSFSVGEMMAHRPALRRCSAASQTSPISDKICASLHSAAAERSYPNKLVRVSEVGPKHSTSFSDTDSPKGSSASLLQHLFTTCERQKGSTGEDIGTPAPACVSGAAGLPIVSPNEGDATAIADVDACPPAVADSPLSAMPNYTACATLEVVPLGLRSDVSSGHKPPNLSTRCGDSAGDEPGDAATRTASLVAGELFAAFAASTLPRRAMSPKVSSICEGAASSASHGSTEGWMSTLQPRFSGNPSCTMAFFDQAVAKGPSRKSKKCESHRPTLSDDDPHSSRRLSSSPHGDATFMVVDALLQLQRIGRGFLIRRQCKQRYWEKHEERSLDLLLQRVLLQAPIPFPGAAVVEEDDTASWIEGKNAASGVSAVASILTGVSSTSSFSTTGGQITTTASLPSSMPSASRASPPLATTMIPGHHQHPSPVDGQRVLCSPSHASPLFPEETVFSGSEDAAGIPAGDAPLSEDRSPTAALCSKTVPMLVTPDNTNYILAPALASPDQRTSVLLTSPLSNMIGLALRSDASRPFRGGVGSGAVGASFKCQEARVTGAFCGGYTSYDSVPDAVTVGGSRSCDDDTAVAPPLVPSLTVSLPSTAASPLEDATKSGDTAHTLAIRSPSPPRLMSLSPPSLRVSFPRCSYPSPGSISTVGTPGSAAPVTRTLGVLIPLPMSLSGTKSASCNEGTRPVLSPHRSPPSYFALQRPFHNDVASTVVERNNTSVCHAPRRRYFAAAAAAAAAGAELSPMDGSIFATSGRSARSLNSMNSLPFSFSVTANAMSVTGQNFSTPLSEGLALQPWVLDGVQIVSTFSSDCDSSDNEAVEQETTSSSSSSSDNKVACNDTEGDPLKRDLICVEEAGAEPACFGAAVQILGHEAAPPSMSKALLLLQRIGRGYLCRRRQHFIFMVSISWAEIALVQRVSLGFLSRKRLGLEYFVHCEAKRQMSYWELRNRSAVLMQSVVRGFIGRQRAKRLQRRVFTRIELLAAGEQLYTD